MKEKQEERQKLINRQIKVLDGLRNKENDILNKQVE
jgi:hypothetical protein